MSERSKLSAVHSYDLCHIHITHYDKKYANLKQNETCFGGFNTLILIEPERKGGGGLLSKASTQRKHVDINRNSVGFVCVCVLLKVFGIGLHGRWGEEGGEFTLGYNTREVEMN